MDEVVTVAGIGCRRGVAAAEVMAAVAAALARSGLEASALTALATVPAKAGEPALAEAARRLGLPLHIAEAAALAGARVLTRSPRSQAATGAPSASEAAALALAGPRARLLAPRLATGRVTCALAVGEASA